MTGATQDMHYRPITDVDVELCADVFYVADDALMARLGLPPNPRNLQNLLRLFRHMVATDPERMWLADEDGQVIGFGMAVQRDRLVFLAMLFILPTHQAHGTGRELLERCMAGSERSAVCIFSPQPISAALYARYGMVPRVPMYTLTGRPRGTLRELPTGFEVANLDLEATAELDQEVTGMTRPQDHAAWEEGGRARFGLFRNGACAGYGYAQPAGRLGPVIVRDAELLLPFVGRLMQQVEPVEDWMINVPGRADETFAELLRQGFRLEGPPIIYCASGDETDHSRYLPATFALP